MTCSPPPGTEPGTWHKLKTRNFDYVLGLWDGRSTLRRLLTLAPNEQQFPLRARSF